MRTIQVTHDSSGVRVTLSRALRPHNAWSFEFMPYNMAIPPGAHAYEYTSRVPPDALQRMLGDDLRRGNGTIRLRQVHAHAHTHATRVALIERGARCRGWSRQRSSLRGGRPLRRCCARR